MKTKVRKKRVAIQKMKTYTWRIHIFFKEFANES